MRSGALIGIVGGLIALCGPTAPAAAQEFLRGDCNIDGEVDLEDVLYLFCPFCDPGPLCLDACDVNDDGQYDISDSIQLLVHLFSDGDPPGAPYPSCGPDPTADNLGCDVYDCSAVPPPPAVDPTYILGIAEVMGSPGQTVEVPVTFQVGEEGAHMWSFGVAHDPAALSLVGVEASPALLALFAPDFFEVQVTATGYTLVTFLSLLPGMTLLDPGLQEVAVAEYTVLGSVGETTTLDFAEDLTDPAVAVEFSYSLFAVVPGKTPGSVTVGVGFRRGDVNTDGLVDIADPVFDLMCLFLCFPVCPDAHDVNDDGQWDIADPIYTLGYLFIGTDPPAPPFLECGADPTPDSLPCSDYADCP